MAMYKKTVLGKRCYVCGNRASTGFMHGVDKVDPTLPYRASLPNGTPNAQ